MEQFWKCTYCHRIEVPDINAAFVTDTTLQNSEAVIAVNDSCSYKTGYFVNQARESLLSHISEYGNPEHCKCQNACQKRSIITSKSPGKNAVMGEGGGGAQLSKRKGPKIIFQENYDCEDEEREIERSVADLLLMAGF